MTGEKENLRGKDALNLIEQVQRDRTLINMRLRKSGIELLTLIDDIETSKKGGVFAVDLTADMKVGLDSANYDSLEFEFLDSNKVPCGFTAHAAEITFDRLWVMLPDVIHREQKREHFRVEAPLSARLCFTKDTVNYMLNVSNISMGGILVTLRIGANRDRILTVGERIQDIQLAFPSDSVQIREAVVAWKEEGVVGRSIHFGIQFTGMRIDQRRILKEILYDLQRAFLARRAGTA